MLILIVEFRNRKTDKIIVCLIGYSIKRILNDLLTSVGQVLSGCYN